MQLDYYEYPIGIIRNKNQWMRILYEVLLFNRLLSDYNRLLDFKFTPFEKNDPVIFGFDIIMDDISSPLLNGSILDFINNYFNISEIKSKENVYEDFKQQFINITFILNSIFSSSLLILLQSK